MESSSLCPDPAGPERVAREVKDILAALPFVRSIALFGSVADDTGDRWSDVDMLVACDDAEASKWIAASAIREAKPVLFYRTFYTFGAPQPSGRYWFADESPFHKIDLSFHTGEEYRQLMLEPTRFGYDISYREMYNSSQEYDGASIITIQPFPVSVCELETEVGNWISRILHRMKLNLRGEKPITEIMETAEDFRAILQGISRDTVMPGGNIGRLAYEALDMAEHLTATAASSKLHKPHNP